MGRHCDARASSASRLCYFLVRPIHRVQRPGPGHDCACRVSGHTQATGEPGRVREGRPAPFLSSFRHCDPFCGTHLPRARAIHWPSRKRQAASLRVLLPVLLALPPIPIVLIVTVYFVTTPACVVEERGPFGSMGRSAQLTKGHRWRIFGLELLLIGLLLIASILIGLLNWTLSTIGGPLLGAISGFLWNAVWVACYAVMVAVAYYDLRVAKEGIDIEQIVEAFD